MFKKKETNLKSANRDIQARFVKKDGVATDFGAPIYAYPQSQSYQSRNARYISDVIPANEISESYISSKQSGRSSGSNSAKTIRKKFPPSFLLLRRKKNQSGNKHDYENIDIDEEDVTDIAYYEDLVAEQESINPVMLGQLDDSQLNTMEQEPFEELYKGRLDFVLNNYRKPPPYPGKKSANSTANQLQNSADTPLLRQLLKDKNINDNASMNNFWQASPGHKPQNGSYLDKKSISNDKLVSRTHDIVTRPPALNAGDLYKQRKQYYFESMNNLQGNKVQKEFKKDTVSEIYPAKDYEIDTERLPTSASVPNLSVQAEFQDNMSDLSQMHPKVYMELSEMEALIAHYRKTSLDNLEPYDMHSSASESVSLYTQGSPSYIPPSPYMNAEIPEWLQVYAKASPDLDKFLKWGMFRYPELDCWQTMLKRLYKKEVKQVVLWFEEYRLALQKELENRKMVLGIKPTGVLKKTEV
ncbi:uncharacterized protein LOC130656208 [Hydractinia symbiolongicarpus]|uniref:uncharacterized protein LOC130656208 n=1 Tax=Hydractinia symbiolongicarpus TaxID=13093 RepID=UPI00254CCC73|nr:uncharacterized protein LOC130656208 [Hydractinia symbiolongicarpus]